MRTFGVHPRAFTCIRAHSRASAHVLAHSRAFTHVCAHSHASARIRAHRRTFLRIHAHSRTSARIRVHSRASEYVLANPHAPTCICTLVSRASGVPSLEEFQSARREIARSKNTPTQEFESRADLINWGRKKQLPQFADEMDANILYAVDTIFDVWDDFVEPGGEYTLALPLISKQCVGWVQQLTKLKHAWALHGDGKHKLHIGKWVLMTFGTHCLRWDSDAKTYRHSFRPLIYVFSKSIESVQAVRLGMVALQMVAKRFTGEHCIPPPLPPSHSHMLVCGTVHTRR